MRFLIDNALSARVAQRLRQVGHDAVHLRDYGMQSAPDEIVFERAGSEDRILVSADTDFGGILATRAVDRPSVILFRHGSPRKPDAIADQLLANLPSLAEAL